MRRKILVCLLLVISLFVQVNAQDIFSAAKEGDLVRIRQLISENKDLVKESDENMRTALHYAAQKGYVEIVEYLLENGADANAQEKYGMTPLFYAADGGLLELADLLVGNGSDVNAVSPIFGTPLHRSIFMGHIEMARFLLDKGARTSEQNATGTPLHTAAIRGRFDIARLLIERGADVNSVNSSGITPLYYALSTGHERTSDLAMLFIETNADVNATSDEGISILMLAVQKGFADVTRELLNRGADIDVGDAATDRSLLHLAAIAGYGDVADILVRFGLDVTAKDLFGRTPLYYAGKFGNKTVADRLLAGGAPMEEMEKNYGDSKYLKKKMNEGEAYIWLMKNRGYVIKTKNHLLVFDNEETGRKPDAPSVDNGYYSVSELRDQNVLALYSAYHAEPNTMEFIHALEDSIEQITYLHYKDDRWRGGNRSIYLKGHETHTIDDVEIVTMETHDAYGMGSLGYLVKVDGITLFYSSFPTSELEGYKQEVDFIAGQAGTCDLVFVMAMPDQGEICGEYILDHLKPKAILPMGHKSLHKHFKEITEKLAEKRPEMHTGRPRDGGDRFYYKNGKLYR